MHQIRNITFVLTMLLISIKLHAAIDPETCKGWSTFNISYEWVDCKWATEWRGDSIDALKASAKDAIKDAALNELANAVPGGTIIAAVLGAKGPSGPSEIQLATERILEAIEKSDQRLLSKLQEYFEADGYADLYALQSDLVFFHNDNITVEQQVENRADLRAIRSWVTSVKEKFRTMSNTNEGGIADALHTYQAYISLVALELSLHVEYAALNNYGEEFGEEQAQSAVLANYRESIENAFEYVNSLNWHEDVLNLVANVKYDLDHISSKGHKYVEFDYRGNPYRIGVHCDKHYPVPGRGAGQNWNWVDCSYGIQGETLAQTLGISEGHQYYISHLEMHEFDIVGIYNDFLYKLERQIIIDGYASTQEILDSWQEFIHPGTPRTPNYADQKLLEYFPDYSKLDSDNDGFDDQFEMNNSNIGFDPNAWNYGEEDYDGDGASNIEEYLAGTDIANENDNPERRKLLAAMIPIINLVLQ